MKNPEALDWYRFAKMDMQSAKTLDEHSRPKPLEIICYLSEQCVEKMLKGFLVSSSQTPPRTHDLPLLCDMCIELDERFAELSDICEFLTLYGVQPRYPNELEILNEDAAKAKKQLDKLGNSVKIIIASWLHKNIDGCDNPRKYGKALKGSLSGQWRYEVGNYRILCEIQDSELIVLALNIGHRRSIYLSK